jgi:hypothetical protein
MIHKQQDAARRRHHSALKTFATVKKLLKPAPSTLELLRYPVGKGGGDMTKPYPRPELAAALAGTS